MEYYCAMVMTGCERSFKAFAKELFHEDFPSAEFFFFERKMRTNQGKWFDAPLFPGYIFFSVDSLSKEFFTRLRKISGFCRVLPDNAAPLKITGSALDELKLFIKNGENWGISKVKFLPGKQIRVSSGPLCGMEGMIYKVNKKRKRITVYSSLVSGSMKFDLFYEDVDLVDEGPEKS